MNQKAWTYGQNEVVTEQHDGYVVYKSVPCKTFADVLADNPPTSEQAAARGLRRIKRRHFSELKDRMSLESRARVEQRTAKMLTEIS